MKAFYGCAFIIACFFAVVNAYAEDDIQPNLEMIADNLKFENAEQFIKLGFEDKAMQELHEYLEIFPHGNHRSEAFTRLAGIYSSEYQYERAVEMMLRHFEEFSTSEAGVEAYFHAGMMYRKMGYESEAEVIFNRIIKEYPASAYSSKASVQLQLAAIMK